MPYVATISTPGYLPDSAEPSPIFDTAREAWEYLASEHESATLEADTYDYGTAAELWSAVRQNGEGSVYGPTPGYGGRHDLGVVYEVFYTDESAGE